MGRLMGRRALLAASLFFAVNGALADRRDHDDALQLR